MLSEVKKDFSFRIDSEYFKKESLNIFNSKIISKNFEDIILLVHNGKDCREYVENGKFYIRTGDITKYGISFDKMVQISNNFKSNMQIEIGDLLITRKGNYGKTDVVHNNKIKNCVLSSEIFHVRLKNINPYFVDVFFKSKFGQKQIEKNIHGVSNFSITQESLKNIQIPIFSQQFQQNIETLVKKSYTSLEQSKQLYKQAEDILNKELQLDKFEPSNNNISIRNFSEYKKVNRLDAEYFQPKYDDFLKKVKKYTNGFTTIKAEFTHIKDKCDRKNIKYNYVEIGDVSISSGMTEYNEILTNNLPDNAKIMTKKGHVIISTVRPNRGAVAILDEDNFLVSGAFTVLQEKNNYKKEVLLVLLKTKLYREWLLEFNVGTSYPVIKDDDILNMLLPKIDTRIQQQIAEKVQESFKLRKQSKDLLNLAKQVVEIAIEKNETEALKLIN